MTPHRVMFVDDEELFRSMLTACFGKKFNMAVVGGAVEALSLLEKEPFDLVVSDINMPGMDGPSFLTEVHKRFPSVKTALLTSSDIDGYVGFARGNAVCSVIPKSIPFNITEVERTIKGLLTGDIFGLSRYLGSNDDGVASGVMAGAYCVKSSAEALKVRESIVAEIEKLFGSAGDTQLVLDEILMNALYHAPVREDGSKKYSQFSEVELDPSEYVDVEFGYDLEKYGVSVLDKCGALTKEIVLSKMERQITGEGGMDDSGRGLHMCRLFADRLVINIERGVRTEVIMMNYLNGKYSGYKPLYINEV
jgi:DNA-binding NarL/FixJ family response regulator